ncbi:MAG TPA: chemotaxis protein CheV [Nitrospirae bacterium]|nr:chemotaxis protein CheV [Nitrospirota bacterium]
MNSVGAMEEVEKRTSLALSNKMEMLIFYLYDRQLYGINVFKIIEILECPKAMTKLPLANPAICGAIDFRGNPVTVIDLGFVLGLPKVDYAKMICYIVICDYNNTINGFLIINPDSLINRSWDEIKSPSGMLTKSAYLTAIAYNDNGDTIQILDIEKILSEVIGVDEILSDEFSNLKDDMSQYHILLIDDSKTARQLVQSVLEKLGVTFTIFDSAVDAIENLKQRARAGEELVKTINLIICDIEMPEMDGFTFVRKIRENNLLSNLKVMLHSSMSNPSNKMKANLVGANDFVAKFKPNELAERIIHHLRMVNSVE